MQKILRTRPVYSFSQKYRSPKNPCVTTSPFSPTEMKHSTKKPIFWESMLCSYDGQKSVVSVRASSGFMRTSRAKRTRTCPTWEVKSIEMRKTYVCSLDFLKSWMAAVFKAAELFLISFWLEASILVLGLHSAIKGQARLSIDSVSCHSEDGNARMKTLLVFSFFSLFSTLLGQQQWAATDTDAPPLVYYLLRSSTCWIRSNDRSSDLEHNVSRGTYRRKAVTQTRFSYEIQSPFVRFP